MQGSTVHTCNAVGHDVIQPLVEPRSPQTASLEADSNPQAIAVQNQDGEVASSLMILWSTLLGSQDFSDALIIATLVACSPLSRIGNPQQ